MTTTQELLHTLLELEESEFLEFKRSDKLEFGEYLSAISNGACLRNEDFGYLIFGVNDKTRKIEGTTVKRSDLERAAIRSSLNPKIDYSIHVFEFETKPIILVKIAAAKGEPTFYKGRSYARIGEDKTRLQNLTTAQIQRIYNSRTDWSELIVESATIGDLDEDALKKAREKFKEKAENKKYLSEVDNWDTTTFLDKADLTIKGKITNCALILLGKRESRKLLKYSNASEITWELRDEKDSLVSYERFYPPFLLSIEDAWKMVRNTKYLHPTNQLLNVEVPRYDNETITEALNNCIAHQYYFSNDRGIILVEKSDRLIFENFGNFFEGKPEDYALGKTKAHKYRNQLLVSAMTHLGMIDKYGTGIGKMYKAQRRRFFPMPDYSQSTSEKVILQIYGKIIDERFSQILMEKDLDLTTTILLDHVQKKLPITLSAAKLLKKRNLIDGKKSQYFISSGIAEIVGQKAKYTTDKGFSDEECKDFIIKHLKNFRDGDSRNGIKELIWKNLPNVLSDDQKINKITNLLSSLRREGRIKNHGSFKRPTWKVIDENYK